MGRLKPLSEVCMQGYFRYPTVFDSMVAFVSEDDIWSVPLEGGVARRLTAGLGSMSRPNYSPDGKWLAVSSAEEGHMEVFVMPSQGGPLKRLTYLGSQSLVSGWKDNETILFTSIAQSAHRMPGMYELSIRGGSPVPLNLGPVVNLSLSSNGEIALERNSHRPDPAHWKRYRGGTAGNLWYASNLEGEFRRLIDLKGNLSRPVWIGSRIYFSSDHEGVGNIYSCDSSGRDLRAHSKFKDYYARNPSTDGKSVVFHSGGDLFALKAGADSPRKIEIEYHSQRTQRQRKFVPAWQNLEWAALDGKGRQIAVTTRGRVHAMGNWHGPVASVPSLGSRYRLGEFMSDDKRLIAVTDHGGEEHLEIFELETKQIRKIPDAKWGRFTALKPSPRGEKVAFTNHRNEVWIVDTAKGTSKLLTRSHHDKLDQVAWSPDGRWLAFAVSDDWYRNHLCIADADTGEIHPVTTPFLKDYSPCFDPSGRYLFFLSLRELNPVYDAVQFELSFPKASVPCMITLKKDTPSPFLSVGPETPEPAAPGAAAQEVKVEIDFEGIEDRIQSFPVPEAQYSELWALKDKVLWTIEPVEGALTDVHYSQAPSKKDALEAFDFALQKAQPIAGGVAGVSVSRDGSQMLLRFGTDLRVVKAGEKVEPPVGEKAYDSKGGYISLNRIKNLIDPSLEWNQMLHEVWRLQRDHYWREDMCNINWAGVLKRYAPLVDRVNTRSEFGDLVWELQGELGTSHAYDMGGDYRPNPSYLVGLLGADFEWDDSSKGYRITNILRGDLWKRKEASPLKAPGVGLRPGDVVTAINGLPLARDITPHHLLWHRAGDEVELNVRLQGGKEKTFRVKTLSDETKARYRDWVEENRDIIAKRTNGRVGYIHIPDMSAFGFSEFHRHFLRDWDKDALIVDARYNGGGHVSQLLLEKLSRKRTGADETRWFGVIPYPNEAPAGPMVALTNEYAGSDGDMFSHTFKMKKAGPLIGRRTWGGVVGISPRHRLVDGGLTTQPEYSHWFSDVGWKVENYGVDPDIDVDIAPHDYRRGNDPQLERALNEIEKLLVKEPPFRPKLSDYPDLGFQA